MFDAAAVVPGLLAEPTGGEWDHRQRGARRCRPVGVAAARVPANACDVAPGSAPAGRAVHRRLPDFRDYGDSGKLPSDASQEPYAKRVMARDQVELMRALGFDPTWRGRPRPGRPGSPPAGPRPRRRVNAAGRARYRPHPRHLCHPGREARHHGVAVRLPGPVPGPAGTADRRRPRLLHRPHPRRMVCHAGRAGRRRGRGVPAPLRGGQDRRDLRGLPRRRDHRPRPRRRRRGTLDRLPGAGVVEHIGIGSFYDVLSIWREQADDVRGRALDCGHFLAEERPDETATELLAFLRGRPGTTAVRSATGPRPAGHTLNGPMRSPLPIETDAEAADGPGWPPRLAARCGERGAGQRQPAVGGGPIRRRGPRRRRVDPA
jgi:haloacetate dehalogenase